MNGQMKKYKESLASTPEPILLSQLKQKVDIKALIAYSKEKGVPVSSLTQAEKMRFVSAR